MYCRYGVLLDESIYMRITGYSIVSVAGLSLVLKVDVSEVVMLFKNLFN